jgi:hypothetical protein
MNVCQCQLQGNADSLLQSNGSFTALHGELELSEALERLAFDKLRP